MKYNGDKTHCVHGHPFSKDNTALYKQGKYITRVCLTCRSVRAKAYRTLYPEKVALKHKAEDCKKRFGISLEEYNRLLKLQNNKCALCGGEFEGTGTEKLSPSLDHNHVTGALREFIHHTCNTAIGFLNDDPKLCRLAAEYLEKHIGETNVHI
jgi:hypothetical protein